MANSDWNTYSHVKLNIVNWPPSRAIGNGMVRTSWELEALADLPLEEGSSIDLAGISRDMDFAVTVTGRRTMTMSCICDENMAHPYRLGSAGLAWRFIDERYGRLWMIGASPRAHYPTFMRQRREMVDQLVPSAKSLWIWLSMIRSEPLLAAILGEESAAGQLLDIVGKGSFESSAIELFSILAAKLEGGVSNLDSTKVPYIEDAVALLNQAVAAAINGSKIGSVDLLAAATERLFDTLLLVDQDSIGKQSSTGFAAEEDRAWFADCKFLASHGINQLAPVIDRSRHMSIHLSNII